MPADPSPSPALSWPLPPSLHGGTTLLDGEIPPPDFVIKPFFPRGELTEIVGAHGNFKSTIALDACLAVASGRPWGGITPAQGRSVFITLEDSVATLARRTRAWLRGIYDYGEIRAAECAIRENFRYLAREGSQGLVLTATREGSTSARLDVSDHLAHLIDGASLVVLETVSRLHDGPETNDAFAALIRSLERVVARGDAALVVVRHMSKKAAREMVADQLDSYAGRGGGALSDAMRSVLIVTRKRGDALSHVTLTVAKATHARGGDTITWAPREESGLDCIRLEPVTPGMQALTDADHLLAHVSAGAWEEEGFTKKELHNRPPVGVSREKAKRALDLLAASGRIRTRKEERGRNRQLVTVYYVPRPGVEVP